MGREGKQRRKGGSKKEFGPLIFKTDRRPCFGPTKFNCKSKIINKENVRKRINGRLLKLTISVQSFCVYKFFVFTRPSDRPTTRIRPQAPYRQIFCNDTRLERKMCYLAVYITKFSIIDRRFIGCKRRFISAIATTSRTLMKCFADSVQLYS